MRSEKHQPPPVHRPNQICMLCGSSPNMTAFCHGNHTRCRLLSAPKLADAQSQIPGVSHHHKKFVVTTDGFAHVSIKKKSFSPLGWPSGSNTSIKVMFRDHRKPVRINAECLLPFRLCPSDSRSCPSRRWRLALRSTRHSGTLGGACRCRLPSGRRRWSPRRLSYPSSEKLASPHPSWLETLEAERDERWGGQKQKHTSDAAIGAAGTHPQSNEELVKVNGSTPVAVEMLENSRGLFFIDRDSEVIQTL